MTFSRRVGGQVSVPMHMHPISDPLAQQAAHYQAYADRSDPYAFGFTAALNAQQRHAQQVAAHAAAGANADGVGGYARNGGRQGRVRRSGAQRRQGGGAAAGGATSVPSSAKQPTFVQRIAEVNVRVLCGIKI